MQVHCQKLNSFWKPDLKVSSPGMVARTATTTEATGMPTRREDMADSSLMLTTSTWVAWLRNKLVIAKKPCTYLSSLGKNFLQRRILHDQRCLLPICTIRQLADKLYTFIFSCLTGQFSRWPCHSLTVLRYFLGIFNVFGVNFGIQVHIRYDIFPGFCT